MYDLDVSCVTAADGWLCHVTVKDQEGETRHSVSLSRAELQRLASSGEPPERLVTRSFEFLLDREPRRSILPSFALPEIGRYFPEYDREMAKGTR